MEYSSNYFKKFRKPNRPLEVGDYVLASKYRDGDPNDPWFVGFIKQIIRCEDYDKYKIADEDGNLLYSSMLARAERIGKANGHQLVRCKKYIKESNKSVYYWKNNTKELTILGDMLGIST